MNDAHNIRSLYREFAFDRVLAEVTAKSRRQVRRRLVTWHPPTSTYMGELFCVVVVRTSAAGIGDCPSGDVALEELPGAAIEAIA